MMRGFLAGAVLLMGFLSQPAWADKEYRIVIFGDSLAIGQQVQPEDPLSTKLQRKVVAAGYSRVVVSNMSKPATTTATAIKDVDLVKSQLPDVVIIMLGMNDIMQGVPPKAIYDNIARIANSLKSQSPYIILVGIPAPANRGENYRYEVQRAYYGLAAALGLPFYYSALAGIEGNQEYTMADGISPNSQGLDIMVEGLFPYVDTGLRWRYEVYLHEQEVRNRQYIDGSMIPVP